MRAIPSGNVSNILSHL